MAYVTGVGRGSRGGAAARPVIVKLHSFMVLGQLFRTLFLEDNN